MASVLITGCSSGFGMLSALEFARQGHTVWATMRSLDRSANLLERAAAEGAAVQVGELDVRDEDSVRRAVDWAGADNIDVVVNNAGIEGRGAVEEFDDDEVLAVFDTNVFGPLRLVRAVAPSMRERGSGVIVNVGSLAGLIGTPFGGIYSATKHAIEALTEAMHYELEPFGIRVAVVDPAMFATNLVANAFVARRHIPSSPYYETSERYHKAIAGLAPDGAPSDPAEVARAIVAAATDPDAPVHHVVGEVAQLTVAARHSTDFETFSQLMRDQLGWQD